MTTGSHALAPAHIPLEEDPPAMPNPTPRQDAEEAVNHAYEQEAKALMKAQRLRFILGITVSAGLGFGLGAFTTYKIACSLRPRR